jgi:hypothetical protein
VGAALIAVLVDGASWYEGGPYPSIFTKRELLAFDFYLLAVLLVGLGFATAGAVYARRSPYPRTDAFGAGLMGSILTGLGGLILFTRVLAMILGK